MTLRDAARSVTRPFRRARRLLATSDPDRARLRFAVRAISTLVVVAAILFTLAAVTGQIVTAAIPGIILGMIASTAVRENRPGPRTLTILLLAPAAFVSITLASTLSADLRVADVGFVFVSVLAVFARGFGSRGMAMGMLAFMSYFLAIFVKISTAQLPAVAVALVVSAGVTCVIRQLATPRHVDHDVQRMLSALGDRGRRVAAVLRDASEAGAFDDRRRRMLRSRVASSASTATSIEQALDGSDETVVDGIGNDELAVRVFDFQLTVERLAEAVSAAIQTGILSPEQRRGLSTALASFARALARPVPLAREAGSAPFLGDVPSSPSGADDATSSAVDAPESERRARLGRVLRSALAAWEGVIGRGADASPEDAPEPGHAPDRLDDERAEDARGRASSDSHELSPTDTDTDSVSPATRRLRAIHDMWRQAVQVGVAAALAIAAGTALSSTRWFWAVIAAFVVYIGTSSRGEILTKGWLRVVGTLGGVVVGVLLAAVVGHNTILALVLIVLALFCGFYLSSVSPAFMIFFITTMLALLYGLLGEFSVGLLLLRLEETAAGAAIGIGVAYVVFPTRTRDVARERMGTFLGTLADSVGAATARLGMPGAENEPPSPDDARQLRTEFDDVRTAAKPLTDRIAGVSDRSGTRRTLQTLAACEHHGRSLLRLADRSPGIADTAVLQALLDDAAAAVASNVESLRDGLGGRMADVDLVEAGPLLDAFEDHADTRESQHRLQLIAASRNLRAIDLAIGTRVAELSPAKNQPSTGVRSKVLS